MNKPTSLLEAADRIVDLEKKVKDLIANNNRLLARETANAAVLHTVLWAWGKPKDEVAKALITGGAASLEYVNKQPEVMQQEAVAAWNHAYATLVDPRELPFLIGSKPQVPNQFA